MVHEAQADCVLPHGHEAAGAVDGVKHPVMPLHTDTSSTQLSLMRLPNDYCRRVSGMAHSIIV